MAQFRCRLRPATVEWQQSFGGNGSDECRIVRQNAVGNYILGGYSNSRVSGNKTSANYGNYDFWVLMVDPSGNKIWDESFGGSSIDELYSLQQTSGGGYILGGRSASGASGNKTTPGFGNFDYWIVKLQSMTTSLTSTNSASAFKRDSFQEKP